MDEEGNVEEYERLVEKEKGRMGRLKEVQAAQNNAVLNMNEVTRANAGNPLLGANMNRNAAPWVKWAMILILIFIIVGIFASIVISATHIPT